MQVTINEQQVPVNFAHLRSLEEALVELNARFLPPGQQLFQVRVNGKFFSERYPRESRYVELKDIANLDLRTITDGDMARVILRQAVDQGEILCQGIQRSARLFRVAAEDEANHHFAQVLESLRWLLLTGENACRVLQADLEQVLLSPTGQIVHYFKGLQGLLEEMLEISQEEDYVLLADLMEYELLPLVREWQSLLADLAER